MAASGKIPLDLLTDYIECPICMECDRLPKRLPCEHTMCIDCVEKIFQETQENIYEETSLGDNEIECPICKKRVEVPGGNVHGFPTHLLARQLQEIIQDNPNQAGYAHAIKQSILCHLCPSEKRTAAVLYCKVCSLCLCRDCGSRHKQQSRYRNHTVLSTEVALCRNHHHKYQCFCERCSRLLCVKCLNEGVCEDHSDDVMDMHALEMIKRQELEDLLKIINKGMKDTVGIANPLSSFKYGDTEKANLKDSKDISERLDILLNLRKAALDAKEKGIEQMIIVIPIINSLLPSIESASCLDGGKPNLSDSENSNSIESLRGSSDSDQQEEDELFDHHSDILNYETISDDEAEHNNEDDVPDEIADNVVPEFTLPDNNLHQYINGYEISENQEAEQMIPELQGGHQHKHGTNIGYILAAVVIVLPVLISMVWFHENSNTQGINIDTINQPFESIGIQDCDEDLCHTVENSELNPSYISIPDKGKEKDGPFQGDKDSSLDDPAKKVPSDQESEFNNNHFKKPKAPKHTISKKSKGNNYHKIRKGNILKPRFLENISKRIAKTGAKVWDNIKSRVSKVFDKFKNKKKHQKTNS